MAPVRSVSHRQLELIVEFAERNRNIALNNFRNGPLSHKEANKAWETLARQLNSIGGTHKTPEKWKRYWHLLKCRTKAKAADIRRTQGGSGGIPSKVVPLTDLEDRIVWMIGNVAVARDIQVKVPVNLVPDDDDDASHDVKPTFSTSKMGEPNQEYYEISHSLNIKTDEPVAETQVPQQSSDPLEVTVPRHVPSATHGPRPVSRTTFPPRRPRYRPNNDGSVLRWAYDLEERRIAAEGRLAEAVIGISRTNESILETLQQMANTHAQLLGLLQNNLNS